ncbi:phospholipase D-like domain-containing protein [Alkalilacustris brevis]|uniref:phospholipase D-like domain-containing protein n=1 Tax=Alkalilacustris brevis TaxID=2026338 RepID=UPI000E0CDE42|nr:phosphatidylserine/phosphatidylglycerophosphate/cardiolipin synthase family protein [Alkalilacustris brevis]
MAFFLWFLAFVAVFAVGSVLAIYSYGRFARKARGAASYCLPKAEDQTPLDRIVAPLEAAHPGQTGLALGFDNRESFLLRLQSARLARRSLDLVYYIWRDDMTGRLLARELMAAADRGVRVRLLLDDVNAQGLDPKFRALNGHPGIEVRLFNPIRNRGNALRRGLEILLSWVRFNRRMHAKFWIADGRLAITGGRNIGNDYFDAPTDFGRRPNRDADILMLGPLVDEAGTLFDSYWNSSEALPIAAFWRDYEAGLERFRRRLAVNAQRPATRRYLESLKRLDDTLVDGCLPGNLQWDKGARLVADPPEKALGLGQQHWSPGQLVPVMQSAQERLRVMTPYFVPGRAGMAQLVGLARKGVRIEVLTNALSATNHVVVHGAYRSYRHGLLSAGVRLREFAAHDSGEMLHSKGFSVDGRQAFVGSFNFDLRSAFLNIEAGVLFEAPALVAEFDAEFDRCAAPDQAYSLALGHKARVTWTLCRGNEGRQTILLAHEPEAPALRRGASWLIGMLPIHSYL